MSRIISGKLALNLGPANVAEAIAARRRDRHPGGRRQGHRRSRPSIDDGALTITADADRLQQVVWNLLTNAVKFTPKGGTGRRCGPTGTARTSAFASTDTGEGIRPRVLPVRVRAVPASRRVDDPAPRRPRPRPGHREAARDSRTAGPFAPRARARGRARPSWCDCPRASAIPAGRACRARWSASAALRPRLEGFACSSSTTSKTRAMLVGAVLTEQGAEVLVVGSARRGAARGSRACGPTCW